MLKKFVCMFGFCYCTNFLAKIRTQYQQWQSRNRITVHTITTDSNTATAHNDENSNSINKLGTGQGERKMYYKWAITVKA